MYSIQSMHIIAYRLRGIYPLFIGCFDHIHIIYHSSWMNFPMEKIWKFRRWAQFELNISQRELLSFQSKTQNCQDDSGCKKGGKRSWGQARKKRRNIKKLSNHFCSGAIPSRGNQFLNISVLPHFCPILSWELMQALLRYTVLYKTWSKTFGKFWILFFKMYILHKSRYLEHTMNFLSNTNIYIYIYIWYFSSQIHDPIVSPTKQSGLNIRQRSKNQVILISSNARSSEASPWCWVSR